MLPNKIKLFLGQLFFSKYGNTPNLESQCHSLFNKAKTQVKENHHFVKLLQDADFQQQTKPSLQYYLLNHTEHQAMQHLLNILEKHSLSGNRAYQDFFAHKPSRKIFSSQDLNQLYLPFQKDNFKK